MEVKRQQSAPRCIPRVDPSFLARRPCVQRPEETAVYVCSSCGNCTRDPFWCITASEKQAEHRQLHRQQLRIPSAFEQLFVGWCELCRQTLEQKNPVYCLRCARRLFEDVPPRLFQDENDVVWYTQPTTDDFTHYDLVALFYASVGDPSIFAEDKPENLREFTNPGLELWKSPVEPYVVSTDLDDLRFVFVYPLQPDNSLQLQAIDDVTIAQFALAGRQPIQRLDVRLSPRLTSFDFVIGTEDVYSRLTALLFGNQRLSMDHIQWLSRAAPQLNNIAVQSSEWLTDEMLHNLLALLLLLNSNRALERKQEFERLELKNAFRITDSCFVGDSCSSVVRHLVLDGLTLLSGRNLVLQPSVRLRHVTLVDIGLASLDLHNLTNLDSLMIVNRSPLTVSSYGPSSPLAVALPTSGALRHVAFENVALASEITLPLQTLNSFHTIGMPASSWQFARSRESKILPWTDVVIRDTPGVGGELLSAVLTASPYLRRLVLSNTSVQAPEQLHTMAAAKTLTDLNLSRSPFRVRVATLNQMTGLTALDISYMKFPPLSSAEEKDNRLRLPALRQLSLDVQTPNDVCTVYDSLRSVGAQPERILYRGFPYSQRVFVHPLIPSMHLQQYEMDRLQQWGMKEQVPTLYTAVYPFADRYPLDQFWRTDEQTDLQTVVYQIILPSNVTGRSHQIVRAYTLSFHESIRLDLSISGSCVGVLRRSVLLNDDWRDEPDSSILIYSPHEIVYAITDDLHNIEAGRVNLGGSNVE